MELNKRKLVLELIKNHVKTKNILNFNDLLVDFPFELRQGGKLYKQYDDVLHTNDKTRYFIDDNDVLVFEDGKFVVSNQWGAGNIQNILDQANYLGYEIEIITDEISIIEEAFYEDYQIQRLSNLTITVTKNKIIQTVVKPVLREIALKIDIGLENAKGNPKNTRTLGSDIINKILKMQQEN